MQLGCGPILERAARPTDTLLCMHATRCAAQSRLRRRGPNAATLLRSVGAGEAHRCLRHGRSADKGRYQKCRKRQAAPVPSGPLQPLRPHRRFTSS